jgi:hypothetical protein
MARRDPWLIVGLIALFSLVLLALFGAVSALVDVSRPRGLFHQIAS